VDNEGYIREGYFNYPKEFQERFLDVDAGLDVSGEKQKNIARIVDYEEGNDPD